MASYCRLRSAAMAVVCRAFSAVSSPIHSRSVTADLVLASSRAAALASARAAAPSVLAACSASSNMGRVGCMSASSSSESSESHREPLDLQYLMSRSIAFRSLISVCGVVQITAASFWALVPLTWSPPSACPNPSSSRWACFSCLMCRRSSLVTLLLNSGVRAGPPRDPTDL
eukprot:3933959-Rhodomonas_salina.1